MKIAFLGGGNMAGALIGGLLAKGYPAADLSVVEVVPQARENLVARYKVHVSEAADAVTLAADTLVLAVKPQDMKQAVAPLAGRLGRALVISIAAGIRLEDLSRLLGGHSRVVRVMPNTPAPRGEGRAGEADGAAPTEGRRRAEGTRSNGRNGRSAHPTLRKHPPPILLLAGHWAWAAPALTCRVPRAAVV